jgi:hypothetical protein
VVEWTRMLRGDPSTKCPGQRTTYRPDSFCKARDRQSLRRQRPPQQPSKRRISLSPRIPPRMISPQRGSAGTPSRLTTVAHASSFVSTSRCIRWSLPRCRWPEEPRILQPGAGLFASLLWKAIRCGTSHRVPVLRFCSFRSERSHETRAPRKLRPGSLLPRHRHRRR